VCPWNKFARAASHPDFKVRNELDTASLASLFRWTEAEWNERMQGSAIFRLGYERWLRNVAVALGNAAPDVEARAALERRRESSSPLVREHIDWALSRHRAHAHGPSTAT
jgi:epoxyqueuosine reductase